METQTPRKPYLTTLLIYPTSRCNLKCRHCYFAPNYDEHVSRRDDEVSCEQLCSAIDELMPFGLGACRVSGGEPFLRSDFLDLCRYMDRKQLSINIETNATLVTKEEAEALGQLPQAKFVAVSIDGADAEAHEALRGIKGCFERALQGLTYLTEAGLNVQVIAAAYQSNKDQLARIIDLAAEKGARSFKVCFIHPVGRAKNLSLIGLQESLEIEESLSERAAIAGMRYCSSVPVGLKSLSHIINNCSLRCRCSINSTLAILADGTITVCGMGRYAEDFRFGNLGQDNLTEIWTKHPTLVRIREGLPDRLEGTCGRCVLRTACAGYCRQESEEITLEHFFDPYPKCVTAEELGLFPASRLIKRTDLDAITVA